MKCKKCGKGKMKIVDIVPKLGRRSLGKQFYKLECSFCGEIDYIKPRDYKENE